MQLRFSLQDFLIRVRLFFIGLVKSRISVGLLCIIFMVLTFWIRIQGVERIPKGQFTGKDAYIYYEQAQIIAEQWHLPARDMQRWLPNGRDNRQLLSLYSYTTAYFHKVLPWVSLYHIQLYAPVFFFIIGLGILFFFFTHLFGVIFSSIVTLLLSTLPGSISRSAVGFGDRDALCWFLGVIVIISYLWKEQVLYNTHVEDESGFSTWREVLATAIAGFTVFLGGLSWEAFGFFVIIIIGAELWKFCTTDTEKHLKAYLLWMLMFVPWLYLISPAYRTGYGFSTHLFELMLAPSLMVFALRGVRFLILQYVSHIRPHARKLAWGLTLIGTVTGVIYIFSQAHTFETTAFAFRESRLMQNVTELADPYFRYWTWRYGAVFILGSLGLIAACHQLWKRKALPLILTLVFFTSTTFFREPLSEWLNPNICDIFFVISLGLVPISILFIQKENGGSQLVTIVMILWFFIWVGFARSGKRYDFFIGIPLAYGTAWLLWFSPAYLIQWLKDKKIVYPHIRGKGIAATFAIIVLIPVLFWTPLGGHATRAVRAAQMKNPTPGKGSTERALVWMQTMLPSDSVVAANWAYGSQLNSLAGVRTITDPDHYLPHWIHLYYRHVFCGQTEREALEFLKTHQATHLMLADWRILSQADAYSFVGSNEINDRYFRCYKLERTETPIGTPYRMVPERQNTPLDSIDIESIDAETLSIKAQFKNGTRAQKILNLPNTSTSVDIQIGGLVLFFDNNSRIRNAYYIPPLGWNSLAVKLFFRGEHSKAFLPIYPIEDEESKKIMIWEIKYPPDIEVDEKYLSTQSEDIHDE